MSHSAELRSRQPTKDLKSFLRRRLIQPGFMLEGKPLHEAAVRLSWPVEALMALWQRDVHGAPPIFIMGPQRSGTTLFFKSFMQHQQVCVLDQAADYFPSRYLSSSALFTAIGAHRASDFLHAFDAKKDLWIRTWLNNGYGYTEGNRIWNKLGPDGRWLSGDHRNWAKRFFPPLIRKVRCRARRPVFLSKCPANALRIGQLLELFPDARFIHVERDPRGVINSIVNIHRALNVRSWGPMPVPASQLEGLTEYEAVARQWVAITDAIHRGLADVPANRQRTVRYEEFIGDVQGTMHRLVDAFGLDPFAQPVHTELREERKGGWRAEIPPDEIQRIERIIVDAGYAATMEEAHAGTPDLDAGKT